MAEPASENYPRTEERAKRHGAVVLRRDCGQKEAQRRLDPSLGSKKDFRVEQGRGEANEPGGYDCRQRSQRLQPHASVRFQCRLHRLQSANVQL